MKLLQPVLQNIKEPLPGWVNRMNNTVVGLPVLGAFVLGLMISFLSVVNGFEDTVAIKNEMLEAIKQYESELPRNQSCRYVISAEVTHD